MLCKFEPLGIRQKNIINAMQLRSPVKIRKLLRSYNQKKLTSKQIFSKKLNVGEKLDF